MTPILGHSVGNWHHIRHLEIEQPVSAGLEIHVCEQRRPGIEHELLKRSAGAVSRQTGQHTVPLRRAAFALFKSEGLDMISLVANCCCGKGAACWSLRGSSTTKITKTRQDYLLTNFCELLMVMQKKQTARRASTADGFWGAEGF